MQQKQTNQAFCIEGNSTSFLVVLLFGKERLLVVFCRSNFGCRYHEFEVGVAFVIENLRFESHVETKHDRFASMLTSSD